MMELLILVRDNNLVRLEWMEKATLKVTRVSLVRMSGLTGVTKFG